jgi:hypothetical protein
MAYSRDKRKKFLKAMRSRRDRHIDVSPLIQREIDRGAPEIHVPEGKYICGAIDIGMPPLDVEADNIPLTLDTEFGILPGKELCEEV